MIKITFISTLAYNLFFPGKLKQSGGHTRIYNLIRKFAENTDYQVTCIVGDFGQPPVLWKNNVRIVAAPIDKPWAIIKVLKTLKRLKQDIIVDFIASPRLFLLFLLKLISNTKYIFLTGSETDVTPAYRKQENFLFYAAYRLGLQNADMIVSQVPRHVRLLKKNFNLKSKLVLSPYFEIKAPTRERKKFVLWVGRAATYKNPLIFIRLAKAFPQYKFVMICNKSEYDGGFWKAQVKELMQIPNLIFLEYIPYPQMAEIYRHAKVLVNTSDFEGFPNTFIESAKNYTPILSLNSDPNWMISKHKAGIYCYGDTRVLKMNLEKIMESLNLQTTLGNNAFAYAHQFHQLDQAVKQFDHVFKNVCYK